MKKLSAADILSNDEYLQIRDERRSKMIPLKRMRRIEVGRRICLTFENRETIQYQIQEMMRVKQVQAQDKIQHEIDVYNELIPPPGSLSATLFIEVPDAGQIREVLDSFQGLDQPGILCMVVDGERIPARFEQGRSQEDRISAVHYIQFCLPESSISKFGSAQVEIHVQHPNYKGTVALTQEQKQEIAKDLNKEIRNAD